VGIAYHKKGWQGPSLFIQNKRSCYLFFFAGAFFAVAFFAVPQAPPFDLQAIITSFFKGICPNYHSSNSLSTND